MDLLLDTCALLWLAIGSDRLSITAKEHITSAGTVLVPAVCGFEISLKWRKIPIDSPAIANLKPMKELEGNELEQAFEKMNGEVH